MLKDWKSKSLGAIFIPRWRSWWRFPDIPDPWTEEVDLAVREPDAIPVCHHCITPCEHPYWFCQECGTAIGPYNNSMPFIYIFSYGEALRSGVGSEVQFTPFRVLAYVTIGTLECGPFAPLYWIRLYLNYRRIKRKENGKANHRVKPSEREDDEF